ncbi:MAG: TetR/AcrR family transcriptional regulator [Gammaproteobacteria bacterium]|nr:TetR/AcrR family transcriptional regulator [Gammaproteobacteria bacterium]
MTCPKPPTARTLQRQDTFSRVYEAALSEFRRVGVEQATVSEICRRAGVAKGTFFFHFPTKDHVLLARQQRISEAMAERISAELQDVPDARAFLQRLTKIVMEEHQAVGDVELVRQINLAIVRLGGPAARRGTHRLWRGACETDRPAPAGGSDPLGCECGETRRLPAAQLLRVSAQSSVLLRDEPPAARAPDETPGRGSRHLSHPKLIDRGQSSA